MIARYLRWLRQAKGMGVHGDLFVIQIAADARRVMGSIVVDYNGCVVADDELI